MTAFAQCKGCASPACIVRERCLFGQTARPAEPSAAVIAGWAWGAVQDAWVAAFLTGVGRTEWPDMHDWAAVSARDYAAEVFAKGLPLPLSVSSEAPTAACERSEQCTPAPDEPIDSSSQTPFSDGGDEP